MHPNCPYCHRILLGLNLKKLDPNGFNVTNIDFKNSPNELVNFNKNKTVPTLVLDNQTGFGESILILEYIDRIFPSTQKLFGETEEESAVIKFNLENVNNKLLPFFQNISSPFNQIVNKLNSMKTLPTIKNIFDDFLQDKQYLGGDQANILDVSIAPFINIFTCSPFFKPEQFNNKQMEYFKKIEIMMKPLNLNNESRIDQQKSEYNNIINIKEGDRSKVNDLNSYLLKINKKLENIKRSFWRLSKDEIGPCLSISLEFKSSKNFLVFIDFIDKLQEASDHHTNLVTKGLNSVEISLSTHHPSPAITHVDCLFSEYLTDYICQIDDIV